MNGILNFDLASANLHELDKTDAKVCQLSSLSRMVCLSNRHGLQPSLGTLDRYKEMPFSLELETEH
ncbi:hypothetical protein T4B_10098 [Trichinella pseudospiralis]|uniref:Uncharacterized protein n=2 Tax=Trichinella pseudospiralis TaxID=6337 RepID=A0A0V1EPX0_TRIPS|nr:hypothetical protein T4E_9950 [Trichinella pseudospiralis]KRY75791.1 hypothetical protein T4A_1341 [Trichinella pseudospiralis]KRY84706.1 hypothetical protein T4D_4258 [Trichinella pseudospiralis]KRZ25278.1 hypothetical protein T4B_10098 [Trichinella pseudospiralis]